MQLATRYARQDDPEFVLAAGRAFYVSWWAAAQDEKGRCFAGQDYEQCAPTTPRWALKLARELVDCLIVQQAAPLEAILAGWRATWNDCPHADRDATEANLGWYTAMSAQGMGVGLYDYGIRTEVPRFESYPR